MEVDERSTSRTFGTKYCGRSESAPAANLATEINPPGKTPWLQPRVDVPQAFKGLIYREKQKLTKEEPKRKEYADMAEKVAKSAVELQKKKEAEKKAQEEAKAKQG